MIPVEKRKFPEIFDNTEKRQKTLNKEEKAVVQLYSEFLTLFSPRGFESFPLPKNIDQLNSTFRENRIPALLRKVSNFAHKQLDFLSLLAFFNYEGGVQFLSKAQKLEEELSSLSNSPFALLPQEIRLKIFGYLSNRDLASVAEVNRTFYIDTCDKTLMPQRWTQYHIDRLNSAFNSAIMNNEYYKNGQLIIKKPIQSQEQLNKILEFCTFLPSVCEIDFDLRTLGVKKIAQLIWGAKCIEKCTIDRTNTQPEEITPIFQALQYHSFSLKKIDFSSRSLLPDEIHYLAKLIASCTYLEEIDIYSFFPTHEMDSKILGEAISHHPEIRTLSIGNLIDLSFLKNKLLLTLPKLQSLKIGVIDCQFLIFQLLRDQLPQIKNLEELTIVIQNPRRLSPTPNRIFALPNLPQLKKLGLPSSEIDELLLLNLLPSIQKMRSLEELDLSNNPFPVESLYHALHQIPSLQILKLNQKTIGNIRRFVRVMNTMPNLRELHLQKCFSEEEQKKVLIELIHKKIKVIL